MALDDPKIDKLIALIEDSFRVREDHDPIYVDVGDHLERVRAAQHQVIFGRRGSGKSCLLIHSHRTAENHGTLSIYLSVDEVKRLSYPDVLIRLLLEIFEWMPRQKVPWWTKLRTRREDPVDAVVRELRELLDRADTSSVTLDEGSRDSARLQGRAAARGVGVESEIAAEVSLRRTSAFSEEKLDTLERHLQDYKTTLKDALGWSGYDRAAVLLDDFYLIHPTVQPDVVDYFHRLLRGTSMYLKVGTVRHRTTLVRHEGQTIGLELYQDAEAINLDQTFEEIDATHEYLALMLDSLGKQVDIENVSGKHLSPNGLFALTLASGGVPRDYLTIFVEAIRVARERGTLKWLTPTSVYKGAHRITKRTKLINLREDAAGDATPLEAVFQALLNFCLRAKRKTAFLVSEEEAQQRPSEHDVIKQLMDFKLVHVIEGDTSAASGRPGRYEAYTLDFAFFMEPRRRNIEVVEFWQKDENRRRIGLRESPVFPLADVAAAEHHLPTSATEDMVDALEISTADGGAVDDDSDSLL